MLPHKETFNNILVRLASQNDLEAISNLYKNEMSFHQQFDPLFELSSQFNGVAYFGQYLQNPDDLILVAEESDQVIGYIQVRILKEKAQKKKKSKWAKILGIFQKSKDLAPRFNLRWGYVAGCLVDPQFRSQGIGNLLLDKSIEWLRSNDIPFLDLEVHNLNKTGIDFWQKNGFSTFKLMMRKKL